MMLTNVLNSMWKEVFVTLFKVLSQHLPGVTEENHKKTLG
jgi:hypothetical protein